LIERCPTCGFTALEPLPSGDMYCPTCQPSAPYGTELDGETVFETVERFGAGNWVKVWPKQSSSMSNSRPLTLDGTLKLDE
jgi:uncharacterized Zn finger protein (UPF0148 family)